MRFVKVKIFFVYITDDITYGRSVNVYNIL